jgi:hypothetical protein
VEERDSVGELRERVLTVVLAPHDDRSLDELVRDGCREGVAKDDLILRRLLVRRRRQPDEDPRVKVTNGARERRAVVAVVFVGEDDELLARLKMGIELGPEALLELVRLPADLRLRLDERLNGEEVDLDLRVVVHRRPHHRCVEVL